MFDPFLQQNPVYQNNFAHRQYPGLMAKLALGRRYACGLARTHDEMREAQRIRFEVLVEEMGAMLPGVTAGLDVDDYDMYCEHLLLRDTRSKRAVGTLRILPPEQAEQSGYHSETEFDITSLEPLRKQMAEIGRSCVHANYRDGGTIAHLWAGLADYLMQHDHEYLIGCISISVADGGHYAASVFNKIYQQHAAPTEYRVTPHRRLALETLNGEMDVIIPPLIKLYMRMGAYIGGEPALNADFNCADLFLLLPVASIKARFARNLQRLVM